MITEKNLAGQHFKSFVIIIGLLSIISCQKKQDVYYFHTYIQSDPGRLDPFYSTDVVSGRILTKICNGLFKIDNQGNLKSDLLQSFTFDGKILSATLKKNLFFHDGSFLNSEDIIFSFERIRKSKNPTSPRKWIFNNIKTIINDGDYCFRIILKQSSSTFLFILTMPNCYIISKHALLKEGKVIGSGPFILKRWNRNEEIVLEKNPKYFDTISNIKGIVFKVIPEDLTARFEFINGTIDYFELPYLANINFIKNIQFKGKAIRVLDAPELSVHYIAINNSIYPLNKKLFRQALNMALDRDTIMKSLFKNRLKKASGPVPIKVGDYISKVKSISYNPSQAKKIIEHLKIWDKELTLLIKTDHQVSLISQMIQYYLNKIGLNIKIREIEWSALKTATLNGNYDLAYFTWHADYPEAENFLYPLFFSKNIGIGGNRSFYANKKVDNLLLAAQRTIDKNDRFKIYNKIEKIIIDDAPWIFLWYGDKKIALSERIKEFVPYPIYNGLKGNDITITYKTH